jgi:hypothetical protein
MFSRLLQKSRRRQAVLETARLVVLPMVKTLQKPGHSIPMDVFLDPFVLGYFMFYFQDAVHQALDSTPDEEKALFVDTMEPFFSELSGSNSAGREIVEALVRYSETGDAKFSEGQALAAKYFAVVNGLDAFADDAEVALAHAHGHASLKAASIFGPVNITPQDMAARFLHGKLLHYVSETYGVEKPGWHQWVRGW